MPSTTTPEHHRAVLAAATRDGKHEIAAQARHDMEVALLERRVRALIDAAPALTAEQRDHLAQLFQSGGDK